MRRCFDSQVWGHVICSVADGTRPASAMGTVITPSATPNTYGVYSQVLPGASLTDDAYGIIINFNSAFQSANARDSLLTLGIDPAGGTSFADFILDLSAAAATSYLGIGVEYFFPVFFRANTSIGFKMQQNHATPATARAMVTMLCRPKIEVRAGSYVRTFGADSANSRGALVVQGGASEGVWTPLGAPIADRELWFWEFGVGCNNATMAAAALHCDLGVGNGTDKKLILANGLAITSTTETFSKSDAASLGWGVGVAGDNVYGRCQSSGAPDANFSMLAYGVGG